MWLWHIYKVTEGQNMSLTCWDISLTHIRLAPVGLDHIFNPLQVCDRSQWEAHGVKPLLTPDWIYQKHRHLLFQPTQLAFLLLFILFFSSSFRGMVLAFAAAQPLGHNQANMDFHPTAVSLSSSLCRLLLLPFRFPIGSPVWESERQTERDAHWC